MPTTITLSPHDLRSVAAIIDTALDLIDVMPVPPPWTELVERRVAQTEKLGDLLREVADDLAATYRAGAKK